MGITKMWTVTKGGGNGEDVMKTKNSKIYHLQKGRDVQVRWSSVCAGLCIHLPSLRSSVDDALRTGRTAKGRWGIKCKCVSKSKTKRPFESCSEEQLKYFFKRWLWHTESILKTKTQGLKWIIVTTNQHILAHLTEEWRWVLPLVHGTLASFVPTSLLTNLLHHPEGRKRNTSLVRSRHGGKSSLAHIQQAKGEQSSSQKTDLHRIQVYTTASEHFYRKRESGKNTYFLLFIGSNGSDISSKATVAASVDLLVIKASWIEAHSLVSFLQQGGLHPLDLQDLGLDVCRDTEKQTGEGQKPHRYKENLDNYPCFRLITLNTQRKCCSRVGSDTNSWT